MFLPFWTAFLIRIYAWINILQREGLLNEALLALGIIDEPVVVACDRHRDLSSASSIRICRSWCCRSTPAWRRWTRRCSKPPPISAAPRWKAFWLVTVPLSLPGIVAGALLCFIPIVGEFVIPDLLGGSDALMIGQTLWTEFFQNRDWPVASAVAIVLLVVLLRADPDLSASADARAGGPLMRTRRSSHRFNVTSVALGLAFLYLPIAILVIYSFNASRLVTVWGGWSTRWYVGLLARPAPCSTRPG